jgi:hypothetical protein
MAIKGREFVAREYNRVDLANKYLAIIEGIKKRV